MSPQITISKGCSCRNEAEVHLSSTWHSTSDGLGDDAEDTKNARRKRFKALLPITIPTKPYPSHGPCILRHGHVPDHAQPCAHLKLHEVPCTAPQQTDLPRLPGHRHLKPAKLRTQDRLAIWFPRSSCAVSHRSQRIATVNLCVDG